MKKIISVITVILIMAVVITTNSYAQCERCIQGNSPIHIIHIYSTFSFYCSSTSVTVKSSSYDAVNNITTVQYQDACGGWLVFATAGNVSWLTTGTSIDIYANNGNVNIAVIAN